MRKLLLTNAIDRLAEHMDRPSNMLAMRILTCELKNGQHTLEGRVIIIDLGREFFKFSYCTECQAIVPRETE